MTELLLKPSPSIQSLWTTKVIISHVDVEGTLNDNAMDFDDSSTSNFEALDLAAHLTDTDHCARQWHEWFSALGICPKEIELSLEHWGAGYEAPAVATARDATGWLFLKGEPAQHSDSGNIAVLDPRAASAMSAVPGLPWGRSLILQPVKGALLIVPGWLTASVLPLEAGQAAVVMRASCMAER